MSRGLAGEHGFDSKVRRRLIAPDPSELARLTSSTL